MARSTILTAAVILAVVGCAVGAALFLAHVAWLWHPLGYCTGTPSAVTACKSYNFWSGLSGTNLMSFVASGWLVAWWHQHNCHHKGCPFLQFHPHPEHGHPVCRLHYGKDLIPGSASAEPMLPRA